MTKSRTHSPKPGKSTARVSEQFGHGLEQACRLAGAPELKLLAALHRAIKIGSD
jgi:hypothetical protein